MVEPAAAGKRQPALQKASTPVRVAENRRESGMAAPWGAR